MVLRALLLCAAVAVAGCQKRVPPQRLPESAPIATVLVLDPESRGAVEEGPKALEERLAEALTSRNLKLERAPLAALGGQTISGERVKALARATSAPYRLLVETRAVFFSQLDGRYRWTVGVRLSGARASDGAAVVEEFNLPAVMPYDHQKGQAAVEDVADELARRAALALDALIAAPASAAPEAQPAAAPPATGARPSSIYFLMVDRFHNGDQGNDVAVDLKDPQAFHGGDLAGATQRLDWL